MNDSDINLSVGIISVNPEPDQNKPQSGKHPTAAVVFGFDPLQPAKPERRGIEGVTLVGKNLAED